jgi:tetratricopeptide (TPR) repeat protein
VVQSAIGSGASNFYVTRDEEGYRLVGENSDGREVGNAVLYSLEHNKLKQAKSMLDWERDLTHKAGEDDDLAGPLLPRFWTVGSSKPGADSPEAMRLAAISLLADSMDAKPYLAEISTAREKASGQRQTDLDLLLASAADGAEMPDVALPAALRLMDEEADSLTAVRLAGTAYALKHDANGWLAMLAPRLAKRPADPDLLRQEMFAYQAAGKVAEARKVAQTIMDGGKATSSDYNGFAWMGLFDNHLTEAELKAAQQSNMMSKNGSFADLHTLACVYAAMGKTTEARKVLAQAISAGNLPEPNSAVWYALGLIYEQYGAMDAAIAAYGKVQAHEFDDHAYIDPSSTYLLAQGRLKALTAKTQ